MREVRPRGNHGAGAPAGRSTDWWLLPFGILAFGLTIAVALFAAGVVYSGKLGLELAKGGIQVLVIVIVGSAVAFAFRTLEESRAEQRREDEIAREERLSLDQYRANFVDELWVAYNRVRAARRTLNAYGFRIRDPDLAPEFTEEQSHEYDRQMKELNDAQLTLETLKQKVETDDGRLFDPNRTAISAQLKRIQSYVHEVVGDWELHRNDVRPGKDRATGVSKHAHLSRFLGPSFKEGGIKTELIESTEEAVRLVQKLRFSPDRDEGG